MKSEKCCAVARGAMLPMRQPNSTFIIQHSQLARISFLIKKGRGAQSEPPRPLVPRTQLRAMRQPNSKFKTLHSKLIRSSILHSKFNILDYLPLQYACWCTPLTARPLGSFICFQAASHSSAIEVEHATLASWLTLRAALRLGKCSSKMLR